MYKREKCRWWASNLPSSLKFRQRKLKLNYIFQSFRGIFFSFLSMILNIAKFSGSQFVAKPYEEARGNSKGANTTAWRREGDRFPSLAGKAGFDQACSVRTLPPRAEMGKSLPLSSLPQWIEQVRDLVVGSEMFCFMEAECYHTCQSLRWKKEKYRSWKPMSPKLNSASRWLLFDQYRVGPMFKEFLMSCQHLKIKWSYFHLLLKSCILWPQWAHRSFIVTAS